MEQSCQQNASKKDAHSAPPGVDDAKLAGGASPSPMSREADPGVTKSLEAMTKNIAQMMDEKLEKMALDIKAKMSQSLKEITERVGETEQRILVVGFVS